MMLNYIDLYGQEGSGLAQEGSNAKEQDQTCKTTGSTSAKENPPKNPKDEVRTRGMVSHTPRNIGINELGLRKLRK